MVQITNPTKFSNEKDDSLLVVDGDSISYSTACTLESKTIEVYDSLDPTRLIGKYKTRTRFKESPQFKDNPNYVIKDCQQAFASWESRAKKQLVDNINKVMASTGCSNVLVAMSGESNFRDRLDLPKSYKWNREGTIRPLKLSDVRKILSVLFPTVYADDEEADDVIAKWQFLSFKEPERKIRVSALDKDARGTPGWLHNPTSDTLVFIHGLGFVRLDKKVTSAGKVSYKIYGEGRKWFYVQLLMGDEADGYSPNDIVKGKDNMTDLRTFKLLEHLDTDEKCWQAIVQTYKGWYPKKVEWISAYSGKQMTGTWVDVLQLYADVVHMRRWDNDRLDVRKILEKYGLLE